MLGMRSNTHLYLQISSIYQNFIPNFAIISIPKIAQKKWERFISTNIQPVLLWMEDYAALVKRRTNGLSTEAYIFSR